MKTIPDAVSRYLAVIGGRGGARSRRTLSREQARNMVRVREARKAFRMFHTQCFWYLAKDMKITIRDMTEIARGLRMNGGRKGFLLAERLCR